MNHEHRRILDAEITKNFLALNTVIVKMLVKEFSARITAAGYTSANGYRFYLKGGNAFSMLKGVEPDGDYDFQLRPPDAVYANWNGAFPDIDGRIIAALAETVANVANQIAAMPHPQPGFNTTMFTAAALQEWSRTEGNPVKKAGIKLDGLVQGKRRNNLLKIGTQYVLCKYLQIVKDPQYINGRIEGRVSFSKAEFTAPAAKNFGPMIYVNYTIPGFILYRLAYSYRYSIDGEVFNLKSEIIDISVPRPGSAEVFMSQHGVITHFRRAPEELQFDIPGWGYHFYENINLLQEIELGISGSVHKRDKRINRLEETIDKLAAVNKGKSVLKRVLKMKMKEPQGIGARSLFICGYFGALAHNIFHYGVYNKKAIKDIYKNAGSNLKSRFQISESYWGESRFKDWEKIVYFKLSLNRVKGKNFDKSVNTVAAVKRLIGSKLMHYSDLVLNSNYQYISPLEKLDNEDFMPCDYAVVEVTREKFEALVFRLGTLNDYSPYNNRANPSAFTYLLRCSSHGRGDEFKGTLRVLVKKGGDQLTTPRKTNIRKFLERSILESQRYSMAEVIQKAVANDSTVIENPGTDIISLSPGIPDIYKLLEAKKEKCALKDIFGDLPYYFKENNDIADSSEPVKCSFLSDLVLTNLVFSGKPCEKSIEFKAGIDSHPGFFKEILCFVSIKSDEVFCKITQTDSGEIEFTGSLNVLPDTEIQFSNFNILVNTVMFTSGCTSQTVYVPKFVYECNGGNLPLKIEQDAGGKRRAVYGDFEKSETQSFKNILTVFGLGTIPFADDLPDLVTESIFEKIILRRVMIEASGDASANQGTMNIIDSFSFEITASEPLVLWENKISITPFVDITVDFYDDDQSVNFYMHGQLKIGSSDFQVYINPVLSDISLSLTEGSVLDIAAVSKLFFDIKLPSLKFDDLYASFNYTRNAFIFRMGITDVLEFQAASKKIAVERVSLQVWREAGNFSVTVSGYFKLCEISFELTGSLRADGNYSFASCITNENINVSSLFKDFFGNACLFGGAFDFNISQLIFRFDTGPASSFTFALCAAFCGNDDMLKKLFEAAVNIDVSAAKKENVWCYAINISCEIDVKESQAITCKYCYNSADENKNIIILEYSPKTVADTLTLLDILKIAGFSSIDSSLSFMTRTGITKAELKYDFSLKTLFGEIKTTNDAVFKISLALGENTGYSMVMSSGLSLSLENLPIAGGLVKKFEYAGDKFSVKDITLYALSKPGVIDGRELPGGLCLAFTVLGEGKTWQVYEAKPEKKFLLTDNSMLPQEMSYNNASPAKTFWIKLEKSIKIFTLHRVGLGLDDSRLTLLLDASLSVPPLTFTLFGAGIGVDVSNVKDVKFYISGFAIDFKNDMLTISGALQRNNDRYTGALVISAKAVSVNAIAGYADGGYLMAYAVISAKLGGPPAFFVTGLAAGFGYNQNLALPDIDSVADYPLILGAKGRINQSELPSKLEKYITPCKGQNFLAAGVRFTSFEIIDSFALVTVSFGNKLQIGLLGLSDLNMPPNCKTDPIAHAQLAIRAALTPDDGILTVQALLTSESYILSKNCKLTGGFAFYLWFAGERSGDFVLSLGGYHPNYQKPAHYPDVPRLGFRWDVIPSSPNRLVISGELYFALTPSVLMAGGRLSAVYRLGNLRAWFVLRADFFISWKPFKYDICAGISLGASYKIDFLFVQTTFTIELSCDLHIWGPEFSGTAHITWFIISFTISFGAASAQTDNKIGWDEFKTSFLPVSNVKSESNAAVNPLSISLTGGVVGKSSIDNLQIVRPEDFELSVTTLFLCICVSAEGSAPVSAGSVYVRPMKTTVRKSNLAVKLTLTGVSGKKDKTINLNAEVVKRNVPCALWGDAAAKNELVPDAMCGLTAVIDPVNIKFFPEKGYISGEMLSEINIIKRLNAFDFKKTWKLPEYQAYGTISIVTETAGNLKTKGKEFLRTMGYGGECDITRFAAEADDMLDEDIFAGKII